MMGDRRVDQGALFYYEFCLERHVPQDHLLRAIDRFVACVLTRSRAPRSVCKPRLSRRRSPYSGER